jgi:hypothetical protein
LLFSYPALDDIAGHLARDVFSWTTSDETTTAQQSSQNEDKVLEDIEDLSDEEVDRLFAQRLGTV